MSAKKAFVALAVLLAAAGASAQEATCVDRNFGRATPSDKTRAEVRAELRTEIAQARARGETIPALSGEATVVTKPPAAVAMARSREDVRREVAEGAGLSRSDRMGC